MPSSLVRRPGPLYLTEVGLMEEYYILLNRKYKYSPPTIDPVDPKFLRTIPISHKYEVFLSKYAHLNSAQIYHPDYSFGFADIKYDLEFNFNIVNPAFEARVKLIDEAMDTWAREENIIRLTTYLEELLTYGRTLYAENRSKDGRVSKRKEVEQYLFHPDQIAVCLNGITIEVQKYIEVLIEENTSFESIDAIRQARGLSGVGTSTGAVLPIPLPGKVQGNCCICLVQKPGYIICPDPANHFICVDCIRDAIRDRYFRGEGFQKYKCLCCGKMPSDGFLELLKQPQFADVARLRQGDLDWIPDAAASKCIRCFKPFSVFFRRHHCRRCGLLICQNCSVGSGEQRYCKSGC